MIVLVGESASGKSSIEKELVKKYGYEKIVTYTTRPPREGEVDGRDYHFVTKDQFFQLKEKDFFAETGYYNGWRYGSAKKDYIGKKVAVLTPHGLRQIKWHISQGANIDITSIYIDVPRRDRLIKILQRGDDIEEAYRRSLSDVGQFDGIQDEVDYVIENNGYEKNTNTISNVITNTSLRC